MSAVLKYVVFSLCFGLVALKGYADEMARQKVVEVVERFAVEIVADKQVLSANRALLNERVESILNPVIDFDDFAKKVMGKYYRRASSDQKVRFAAVTKETLLRTYGGSLLEFDRDKVVVLPLGPQSGREVKVNVEFKTDAGAVITIVFFMESNDNDWLLSNVVINDINFGLTFRKQFELMVQNNRNDLDLAITAWQDSLSKGV
jgi:phospholipid transport system substrate-binding protein